jgi:hypothetical protein
MKLLIRYGHQAAEPTQRTNPVGRLGCLVAVSGPPAGQERRFSRAAAAPAQTFGRYLYFGQWVATG